MNKKLAVAFTGPSNSGKTTLILKVARKLIHEHKKEVAIIKHDPGDKARFDVDGKDSFKFSQTGAEVIVTSPNKTTYFSKRNKDLDEMIRLFDKFDILLVEGLKTLPLPRISVFRNSLDIDYFEFMNALELPVAKDTVVANNNPMTDTAIVDTVAVVEAMDTTAVTTAK